MKWLYSEAAEGLAPGHSPEDVLLCAEGVNPLARGC